MSTNLENSAVATGLEKGQFHFQSQRRGNAKKCSNYHTAALISHACKVILKILQARLLQYANWELSDVQARFRKGRGTRNQIANTYWIIERAREFQKTTSASLTVPKPLTVAHNKLLEILKEMGMPDHLTCLLRNLYAGQEATVRTDMTNGLVPN